MAFIKVFFTLILSVMFGGAKSQQQAHPIWAHWNDSQHLTFHLPVDLIMRKDLKFFLHTINTPSELEFELTARSVTNNEIILNTASVPTDLQKKMMNQALVLDVMSGNFLMVRTGIALGGVLDDLFYTDRELGQIWQPNRVEIKIWSPTATNVKLILYENPQSDSPTQSYVMTSNNGVWSITLPHSLQGFYYKFEITNFYPDQQSFKTLLTTDPYSPALSADGKKTLLIDLNDSSTQPKDWLSTDVPVATNKDAVIYESHIRDLSANDFKIKSELRGKYLALTEPQSLVYGQLQQLSQSGVTHLHLLPFFDFASVPEIESEQDSLPDHSWSSPDEAPNAIERIRKTDNYNWGYDPVHWLSPEGSYATSPEGIARIIEIRKMIQSLHKLGLQVTQDVVFNHTYAADFSEPSVLQKIVPFYYYRLGAKGIIANSSCCSDTASEHKMTEKLMADSLKHWITQYKITSFRFDLMSFHSRATMLRLRDIVRKELNKKFKRTTDQVLIFGEAWPFGSLYERTPQQAMTQINSFGSEIATFNDRLRDAIRGGTTSLSELSDQGLVTGLQDHFNHSPRNQNSPLNENDRLQKFLHLKDVVKIGLAGNLRDYKFIEHQGTLQTGGNILFRGAPVGYAQNATETINYVSAHDGTTLWDAIQAKLAHNSEWASPPTASLAERILRHQLALSLILLSQGIPFIEGGSEILKTKNGDVDSYDSGDFYNALNFDLRTHHWNRALPPQWKNISEWMFWKDRISDKSLVPTPQQIQSTFELTKALLKIRKKHALFKLNSADSIQNKLKFLDEEVITDPSVLPMQIENSNINKILVIWNFSRSEKTWQNAVLKNNSWVLAPELSHFTAANIHAETILLRPLSFVVLLSEGLNHD